MNAWWLALDLEFCSYAEVKARRVIAQGWPQLGDMRPYVRMAAAEINRRRFEREIGGLSAQVYGRDDGRAKVGLWRLFQIAAGDLVVALEGTRVRGIAEAPVDAAAGYWLDPRFNYAQCIAHDVEWIDWDPSRVARTPTAPAQSVLAAARIQKERDVVLDAWAILSRPKGI